MAFLGDLAIFRLTIIPLLKLQQTLNGSMNLNGSNIRLVGYNKCSIALILLEINTNNCWTSKKRECFTPLMKFLKFYNEEIFSGNVTLVSFETTSAIYIYISL